VSYVLAICARASGANDESFSDSLLGLVLQYLLSRRLGRSTRRPRLTSSPQIAPTRCRNPNFLIPNPQTLIPHPPQPSTLNPLPSTLDPRPSTLNSESFSLKFSLRNLLPCTINRKNTPVLERLWLEAQVLDGRQPLNPKPKTLNQHRRFSTVDNP
jgi:hypothetical protein